MRTLLLLLVCSFAATFVRAQSPLPKAIAINPGWPVEFRSGKNFIKPLNDTTVVLNNLGLSKRPKAGLYRLPQDNMPCIVPDTKEIAAIPNAFKGAVKTPFIGAPPRIPNAVVPKVFPDVKK